MMREEICTYEVCKLAKEKGLPQDECGVNIGYYAWDGLRKIHSLVNSFAWYNEEYNHDNLYLAATQSLLQRWLREEKKHAISVFWDVLSKAYRYEIVKTIGILEIEVGEKYNYSNPKGFDTYELALEDALKYALENLI